MSLFQQGDVLIKSVDRIPNKEKQVNRTPRGFVLAEGEVTGHAHTIAEDVGLFEVDGVLYMENKDPVTVTHEEHGPVEVPAGTWEIGIVQEYDHFAEEARKVRD